MDQVELLTAIIEASVALLGFSGLVVALGRRASGEWSPVEKLRLINLLGTGVILLGCTLLALTLLSAGLSHAVVWALSSVAWASTYLPCWRQVAPLPLLTKYWCKGTRRKRICSTKLYREVGTPCAISAILWQRC